MASFHTDDEYMAVADIVTIVMLPECRFKPPQTDMPRSYYSVRSGEMLCVFNMRATNSF